MNSNREFTIPHRFSNRLSSDSLRRWLGVGLVLLGVVVGLYQIAPRHDQALFSSVPPSTQDVAYPALSVRAVDSESASRFVGRAIEEIEVGQRVLAHNPDSRFEGDVFEPEPSPDSWRVVRIVMQKHDGGRLDITLLRSLAWLGERGATVGSEIELDTSELNACGQALVTAIEPCPEIEGGEGRVVIGTFRHDSSRIVDLRIEGLDEPIGTTSDHPFWSRDRAGFVEASQLRPGERLLSIEGESLTVESVSERVGSSVVHNLEIQGLHTYTVSTLGVVVHNNCVTGGAPKETVTVYRVQGGKALSGQRGSRQLIDIDEFGDVSIQNTTLNVSIGDEAHALYFQSLRPGSKITSFEIPKWLDDFIEAEAIPQFKYSTDPRNQGGLAPKIVDPNQPGRSFELPSIWAEWLQENAIRGSGRVR